MRDGSYFFIKDADYLSRQSYGAFLVHNVKTSSSNVFFYCSEYEQFWSKVEGRYLDKQNEFKKIDLSPVSFEEILSLDCRGVIDGVASFESGVLKSLIEF